MHDEIRAFMQDPAFKRKFKKAKTADKGHGRVETRTCWQTDDIGWFEDRDKWAGLRSVCMVESVVYDMATKETTREKQNYNSSFLPSGFVSYGYGCFNIFRCRYRSNFC